MNLISPLSGVRRWLIETAGGTFSTAGLSNDGESLSFVYVKADVIHRMDKFIRFSEDRFAHREGF